MQSKLICLNMSSIFMKKLTLKALKNVKWKNLLPLVPGIATALVL